MSWMPSLATAATRGVSITLGFTDIWTASSTSRPARSMAVARLNGRAMLALSAEISALTTLHHVAAGEVVGLEVVDREIARPAFMALMRAMTMVRGRHAAQSHPDEGEEPHVGPRRPRGEPETDGDEIQDQGEHATPPPAGTRAVPELPRRLPITVVALPSARSGRTTMRLPSTRITSIGRAGLDELAPLIPRPRVHRRRSRCPPGAAPTRARPCFPSQTRSCSRAAMRSPRRSTTPSARTSRRPNGRRGRSGIRARDAAIATRRESVDAPAATDHRPPAGALAHHAQAESRDEEHEPENSRDPEARNDEDLDTQEHEPETDEEDLLPSGQAHQPVAPEEQGQAGDAQRPRHAEPRRADLDDDAEDADGHQERADDRMR